MNKVLIVTGGSGGIGAEVVRLAAEQGYAVCINYHSNKNKALELCRELKQKGHPAIIVKADISKESDVVALFIISIVGLYYEQIHP